MIFIDECSHSPESFQRSLGRSERGQDCLIQQLVIGTKSFSLIIGVSIYGIVAWQLIDGTFDDQTFQNFLTQALGPRFSPENVAILDNAAIHRTIESQTTMEEVFQGRYYCGPRYAPHLMPHEEVLSLIKREIREREADATRFLVQTITQVVSLFCVGGLRAHSLRNIYNQYFANHSHYLRI